VVGNISQQKMAEVVETSSSGFIAQCYELYGAPSLGCVLKTGNPPTYAVLKNVVSGALDPGRRVLPRGAEEFQDEDVYRNNPQLVKLLNTRMEASIVGFEQDGKSRPGLPPSSPRLHAAVYVCSPNEVERFTIDTDFLRLLLDTRTPVNDEVIVACLNAAANCHSDPRGFLVTAGRSLARGLRDDLGRLDAILGRLGK
jgi:hypothetical protein